MAFIPKKRTVEINAVRVISEQDDAIDKEKSDFDEYVKTLDDTKLTFLEGKQPTVFLCNFKLNAKEAKIIGNATLQNGEDGRPATAFGSWTMGVTRICLKEIINPDYVPTDDRLRLRKDSAGYINEETLAQLDEYGIVSTIFNYWVALTQTKATDAKNA